MSRPRVGSSSTSNFASMAITRARCSWVTMPFDNSLTLLVRRVSVFARNTSRLRAIESRMHAGYVVERLRNPHPARQHGDIGNEADIPHELIALAPGVPPQHVQLSLIWGESENRVERGGLARAVGADEPKDAALFNTEI